jgi:3-dehydroquinate synthase
MVMAADLSYRLGLIPKSYAQRLRGLIERAGLPVVAPKLGTDRYLELMRHDKKSLAGEIRFVVIDSPGVARLCSADEPLVRQVIEAHSA